PSKPPACRRKRSRSPRRSGLISVAPARGPGATPERGIAQVGCRATMTGERAERFVVLNLRLLAASFAVVGMLFITTPDGVLDVISDLGDWLPLGDFPRAPETTEQFWLALGFAYMVVITGICLVVQADVPRFRPM